MLGFFHVTCHILYNIQHLMFLQIKGKFKGAVMRGKNHTPTCRFDVNSSWRRAQKRFLVVLKNIDFLWIMSFSDDNVRSNKDVSNQDKIWLTNEISIRKSCISSIFFRTNIASWILSKNVLTLIFQVFLKLSQIIICRITLRREMKFDIKPLQNFHPTVLYYHWYYNE